MNRCRQHPCAIHFIYCCGALNFKDMNTITWNGMNTITWNGWTFVAGKRSYWKERHNAKMKNFREKVVIDKEEYDNACKNWFKVFR